MTVSDFFRTEVSRFSGYTAPQLPIASYISQGGSVGDGSGGSVLMSMLFRLGDEPLIVQSQLWNLEQLSVDISVNLDIDFLMRTLNMGQLAPTRVASPEKWALSLRGDGINEAALPLKELSGLPLWFGSTNTAASDAGVRFEFSNVLNRLYAVTIRGYIWGPRSVLAEGGPQRPLNGLFR